MEEEEEKTVPEGKYCHKCGAELPSSADFCPECGAKKVSARKPREVTAKTGAVVEKRETAASAEGIVVFIFGIVGLIFVFMPFYAITESTGYPTYISLTLNLSGFDLARGMTTFAGYSFYLGESYPMIWLALLGSILALVFGLLGTLTSASEAPSSTSLTKLFGAFMAISGILVMIGSIVALIQILAIMVPPTIDVNVPGYGTVTFDVSAFPGFGVFGEAAIGAIIMTLGLIAAVKKPKAR